jgi:GNAT superfamily N-acetyltransferase
MQDAPNIVRFYDAFLRTDYFVRKKQVLSYLHNHRVYLAIENEEIIGLAVVDFKRSHDTLISLLVRSDQRGKGVGAELLKASNPLMIRSKSDQSTGDPLKFYEKHGYKNIGDLKLGRKKNIDLLVKK